TATPFFESEKASEKIPDDAFPGCIGVSATLQVLARSLERNTRATLAPPVANQTLLSPCAVRQELLAANAPSLGNDGGSPAGGICFQVAPPSSLRNKAKCPWMGSLSKIPWRRSQKAIASKKTPGRFSSKTCCQLWPPSVVR